MLQIKGAQVEQGAAELVGRGLSNNHPVYQLFSDQIAPQRDFLLLGGRHGINCLFFGQDSFLDQASGQAVQGDFLHCCCHVNAKSLEYSQPAGCMRLPLIFFLKIDGSMQLTRCLATSIYPTRREGVSKGIPARSSN